MDKFSVTVRLAEKSDIHSLTKWIVTGDYLLYFNRVATGSLQQQKNEVLQWVALNQLVTSPRQTLMIESDQREEIGFAVLADLDWKNRNAAIEIFIDPQFRKSQMAVIAATQIFAYAFNQLGLHKVYSYVFSYNQAMLQVHQDMKQDPEVIYRHHTQVDAKWYDVYVYGFFSDYFQREGYMKKVPGIREYSLMTMLNPKRNVKYFENLLSQLGFGNVKKYQEKRHLPVTGSLDDATLEKILEDIIEKLNRTVDI